MLSLTAVVAKAKASGFKIFDTADYDITLVGLRTQPGTLNSFDDFMCAIYNENKVQQMRVWPITTDPGWYWLHNPMNVNGTAILKEGEQFRGCWKLGTHKGYSALVQNGSPFTVYRDRDMDGDPDYSGPLYHDVAGLNCHKAGLASVKVDKWSAGCQVFANDKDFQEFMTLCRKQIAAGHGSEYSYGVLNW